MTERSARELLAEANATIARLQEALATIQRRGVPQTNSRAVLSREAMTSLRDHEWDAFTRALDRLPVIAQNEGYLAALGYAKGHLANLINAMNVKPARTGDLARSQHRVFMQLNEGEVDGMMRSDAAGQRMRIEFMASVQTFIVAPSYKAIFEKSTEQPTDYYGDER